MGSRFPATCLVVAVSWFRAQMPDTSVTVPPRPMFLLFAAGPAAAAPAAAAAGGPAAAKKEEKKEEKEESDQDMGFSLFD